MNNSLSGYALNIPLAHIELAGEYWSTDLKQGSDLTSLIKQRELIVLVHGWLDNLASFKPLLTDGQLVQLTNKPVLAIDWPGHGLSKHRAAQTIYQLVDYVFDLYSLLQLFKDTKITLVGHSLGGSVAMMLCASYPQLVKRLIIIESLGPLSKPAEQVSQQLAKALQQRFDYHQSEKYKVNGASYFTDIKHLIRARMQANELDEQNAGLLLDRNLTKHAQGYQWRSDPRLRLASPIMMTEQQVISLIRQITTPTKLIYADNGYITKYPQMHNRVEAFTSMQLAELSGGHHVHMQQPQQVAQEIANF